jgi:hypothetical protein
LERALIDVTNGCKVLICTSRVSSESMLGWHHNNKHRNRKLA